MPPGTPVNDDDRAMVAQLLQRHALDGKLTLGELAQRIDTAYRTDEWTALQGLLGDLPVVPTSAPLPAVAPPSPRPARPALAPGAVARIAFKVHLLIYCAVMALLLVIWAGSGAGYFWPMWPALGWGVGLAAHGVGTSTFAR
jgi:hypothetical protein